MSAPNGNLAKYGPQVKELALQGLTAPQVWEAMKAPLRRSQVIRMVQELRRKGDLPKVKSQLTNMTKEYGEQVKALTLKGYKPAQISEELGGAITRQQVSRITRTMRENGTLPPFQGKRPIRPEGLTLGSIAQDVILPLTPEQRNWLYSECDNCGVNTVAEYLLELVRDAHAEASTNK